MTSLMLNELEYKSESSPAAILASKVALEFQIYHTNQITAANNGAKTIQPTYPIFISLIGRPNWLLHTRVQTVLVNLSSEYHYRR